jgi:hypothetical protein
MVQLRLSAVNHFSGMTGFGPEDDIEVLRIPTGLSLPTTIRGLTVRSLALKPGVPAPGEISALL